MQFTKRALALWLLFVECLAKQLKFRRRINMATSKFRGLNVFIQDLRNAQNNPEAERKRVDKEMANIRQKFTSSKGLDSYNRKKYVWKVRALIYGANHRAHVYSYVQDFCGKATLLLCYFYILSHLHFCHWSVLTCLFSPPPEKNKNKTSSLRHYIVFDVDDLHVYDGI